MTITQFGRVEMDPNRVPVPASAKERSSEPSFQKRLETVAETPAPRRRDGQDIGEEPPVDAPESLPERPEAEAPRPESTDRSEVGRSQPLPYRTDRDAEPMRPRTGSQQRPAAQTVKSQPLAAGGGGGTAIEPVKVTRTGIPEGAGPKAAPAPAVQARGSGPLEAKAPAEGIRAARARLAIKPAQPGYRTISKAAVQMVEAARDSVFRQIALRIQGEGGEMRVLLDPPELGQLDLHMVVEKGGTVHLSLVAERPELALVLDKHLAELKQTLQVQGLSIGNTEVRTREDRTQHRGRPEDGGSEEAEAEGDSGLPFQRSGYITAEGLDFWV